MSFAQRTVGCGELRASHEGQTHSVNGWAHKVRDLGGLFFVDVRDRTGIVQVFIDPSLVERHGDIKSETCLTITGQVRKRSESTINPKLPTGEIELVCSEYEILSQAKELPFPLSDEDQMAKVNEELRVKYRYLDLRRPSMYRKLAIRASAIKKIRTYLDSKGFLETETPIITRSTPEGARDYLVPYRLEPGKYYALPQSPQQYKQLLMVAGIERYYQIAKCFRDESQRADRQPEFTQLDLEMSFVTQEDILNLGEELVVSVCNQLIEEFGLDKEKVPPMTRLTYDEALRDFGSDKPDLRFGLKLWEVTEIARECGFSVFKSAVETGARVRGIRFPGGASMSRKEIGELEEFCKEFGAKGMASLIIQDGEGAQTSAGGMKVRGGAAKFFTPEELEAILTEANAEDNDLLCMIADEYMVGSNVLARLRNEIGNRCGLRDPRKLNFIWVIDFPLVEWDADAARWSSVHHPFAAPKEEDLQFLESDPGRVRADCYDIVCNGTEWASGSIRIHRADIQSRVFSLLGIDEATQRSRFGHMLDAFSFGAPPHGGFAPGIDRLVMILLNEENIREVIAFPKMGNGYDPMMDAPSEVDEAQWKEMGLMLIPQMRPLKLPESFNSDGERLLHEFGKWGLGVPYLFQPQRYKLGQGSDEPADMAWVAPDHIVLFYTTSTKGGHEASVSHNKVQAAKFLRHWKQGLVGLEQPIVGSRPIAIPPSDVPIYVALLTETGADFAEPIELGSEIDNIVTCVALPFDSVQSLVKYGGGIADLRNLFDFVSESSQRLGRAAIDAWIADYQLIAQITSGMVSIWPNWNPDARFMNVANLIHTFRRIDSTSPIRTFLINCDLTVLYWLITKVRERMDAALPDGQHWRLSDVHMVDYQRGLKALKDIVNSKGQCLQTGCTIPVRIPEPDVITSAKPAFFESLDTDLGRLTVGFCVATEMQIYNSEVLKLNFEPGDILLSFVAVFDGIGLSISEFL